jgi:hypothetical protein
VLEPRRRDFLATAYAITPFASLNPLQRHRYPLALGISAAFSRERHRLHLDCVDARESAHAVLVKLNRGPIGCTDAIFLLKFRQAVEQAISCGGFVHQRELPVELLRSNGTHLNWAALVSRCTDSLTEAPCHLQHHRDLDFRWVRLAWHVQRRAILPRRVRCRELRGSKFPKP